MQTETGDKAAMILHEYFCGNGFTRRDTKAPVSIPTKPVPVPSFFDVPFDVRETREYSTMRMPLLKHYYWCAWDLCETWSAWVFHHHWAMSAGGFLIIGCNRICDSVAEFVWFVFIFFNKSDLWIDFLGIFCAAMAFDAHLFLISHSALSTHVLTDSRASLPCIKSQKTKSQIHCVCVFPWWVETFNDLTLWKTIGFCGPYWILPHHPWVWLLSGPFCHVVKAQ